MKQQVELGRILREVDEQIHTWANRLKQELSTRGEKAADRHRSVSLYADGSCNNTEDPSTRCAYGGIHGYMGYHHDTPTKVNGHCPSDRGYQKPSHVVSGTVDGMVLSTHGKKVPVIRQMVSIEQSFDMAVKMHPNEKLPATNQRAEVLAMLVALRAANILFGKGLIKHGHIRSDSEYTLNGTTQWVKSWKKNNYISGGKHIKNDDLWRLVSDEMEMLIKHQREVTFEWVKGHKDWLGNIYADRIAASGKLLPQGDVLRFTDGQLGDVLADKPEATEPIVAVDYTLCDMMRAYPRWYHYERTDEELADTHSYYYVGRHGKDNDDDEFGFMMGETVHGVTYVKKQPILELLSKSFMEQTSEERWQPERIYVVDIPLICGKDFLNSVKDTELVYIDKTDGNYTFQDKKVIASRKYPIVAGWDALDNFLFLKGILRDKQKGTLSNPFLLTDVTDLFYGVKTNEKTGKSVNIVKPLDDQTMKVKVRHQFTKSSPVSESFIKLSRNLDFPLRKPFIGSLDKEPKVEVVTWHEGIASYRYALLLTDNSGDCSIWSASHSNLKILTPKEMRE